MMNSNIFEVIMEADGDLEAFDASMTDDTPMDSSSPPVDIPTNNGGGDEEPPPISDDSELAYDDQDSMGTDEMDSDSETLDDSENDKLSEKANNILNQKLYNKFIDKNNEINDVIENLQIITPMLPIEVIKENDISINNLKTALNRGQNYVIDKFINSSYGENLLFYEKLDSLYTLICDNLNKTLKKYSTDN